MTAGGVSVGINDPELAETARKAAERLVADGVPRALAAKTATLWGPDAESEAARRLGWVDLPVSSRALLPRLAELRDTVRSSGAERVVLAGMGGSSLAPEVIARTVGAELLVLDTTDPHQVHRVLSERLDRTVVVVSSKSGTTIETDSHRRIFEQAFRGAGRTDDLTSRFVVVTDPGTSLARYAREAGYPVVEADPNVGGRYSALSAFGLVPTALAGIDVEPLLDEAATVAPTLSAASDNPGLALGSVFGAGAVAGRDKIVLADNGSGMSGFGDWAEQLLAESTGKQGRGLLPVVVEGTGAPGFSGGDDEHLLALGESAGPATSVSGPLGAQFLVWEYATALAGRIIGINPFDQPNVQESKDNTNALL
ncbi:MAG: glucose-6-phosphate isomerase, partial [Nocardioidaceae bacterium]